MPVRIGLLFVAILSLTLLPACDNGGSSNETQPPMIVVGGTGEGSVPCDCEREAEEQLAQVDPTTQPSSMPTSAPTSQPAGVETATACTPNAEQPGASVGDCVTCPVSQETFVITEDSLFVDVEGQTIYVCCETCVSALQLRPEVFLGN